MNSPFLSAYDSNLGQMSMRRGRRRPDFRFDRSRKIEKLPRSLVNEKMNMHSSPARWLKSILVIAPLLSVASLTAFGASEEEGFVSLFDGSTLNGWHLVQRKGGGYGVTNGVIFCERGGGGNLFTDKDFSNFILRLDYKLEPGGNNGIGIRCPDEGDGA